MRRSSAVAMVALAFAVLSACSEDSPATPTARDPSTPSPEPSTSTTGAPPALTCPDRLAQASNATHGFGPRDAARTAPSLPRPTTGIVCAYTPQIASRDANGGAQIRWKRVGEEVRLTPRQLAPIATDLEALEPPPKSYGCNDDLGPRWLLVFPNDSGVVGVVVDDFGCRFVRLTTDPAGTVAGEDPHSAVVQGVLFGPRLFEQRLNVVAGDQLTAS